MKLDVEFFSSVTIKIVFTLKNIVGFSKWNIEKKKTNRKKAETSAEKINGHRCAQTWLTKQPWNVNDIADHQETLSTETQWKS